MHVNLKSLTRFPTPPNTSWTAVIYIPIFPLMDRVNRDNRQAAVGVIY